MMLIPVRILVIASPIAMQTPAQSPFFMDEELIAPADIRSTCLFKTCTAGSAATTKYPTIMPTGINSHFSQPPAASALPISLPTGIKPTVAPDKNRTRPKNV